jgi:hypothetical protein
MGRPRVESEYVFLLSAMYLTAFPGWRLPKGLNGATPRDIVAYGASTVHCAWSNVSENSVRLALDVRYEPVGTPNSVLRSSSRI